MKLPMLIKRFFIPSLFTTVYYLLKYGALVSTRAEVELASTISFGKKTMVGSFTKIKAGAGSLSIGSNVSIGTSCFLAVGTAGLTIGDYCMIAPNVNISAVNLNYADLTKPMALQGSHSKGITIEDNVWIGSGVQILDGAVIGEGSVISAGSIVSGKIPPFSVVQGNPGKVIFTRRG